MFHLVLSATVANAEQHDRVYTDMGGLQDQLAGTIPSINLSSYDMSSELPDTEELYLDENTMFKVINVFDRHGVYPAMTATIINDLLNSGILFRERRRATDPTADEEGNRPEEVREEEGEHSGADLTVSTNAGE